MVNRNFDLRRGKYGLRKIVGFSILAKSGGLGLAGFE
jgi:hypothetical protein